MNFDEDFDPNQNEDYDRLHSICPINQVPSEDCLYLTVATPALQGQASLQGQPAPREQVAVDQNASLPVMVGLSASKYIYLRGQNMTSYS